MGIISGAVQASFVHFFRAVVAAGLGPGEREKNGSARVMPGRRKRERKLRRPFGAKLASAQKGMRCEHVTQSNGGVVQKSPIMKERSRRLFSPKLHVRIEDNNNSPHGKFHRFLFPFSSKISDLNFPSDVLYI